MKVNLQPTFTELVEAYNKLVDEINEITMKSRLAEFDRAQLAALRVRLETVSLQLNAVRLTLKNLDLYAQTEIKPEDVTKDLCRMTPAHQN